MFPFITFAASAKKWVWKVIGGHARKLIAVWIAKLISTYHSHVVAFSRYIHLLHRLDLNSGKESRCLSRFRIVFAFILFSWSSCSHATIGTVWWHRFLTFWGLFAISIEIWRKSRERVEKETRRSREVKRLFRKCIVTSPVNKSSHFKTQNISSHCIYDSWRRAGVESDVLIVLRNLRDLKSLIQRCPFLRSLNSLFTSAVAN